MKKIVIFLSFMCLTECHGMQRLARNVIGLACTGIRASSSQPKIHPCGLGLAIGAGTGAVAGGVIGAGAFLHDGCKSFIDHGFSGDGPLLLVLTPLGGLMGIGAGALIGGAYGATWPVSVPVTVGAIVHSRYKKNKREYERRMRECR